MTRRVRWRAPVPRGAASTAVRTRSEDVTLSAARRRRQRDALLAICAVAVCLVLASLEAAHLVKISAFESRYLPVCRIRNSPETSCLSHSMMDQIPAYSSRVISLLERYDGHGTFFVIGSRAKRYPALLAAEADAGMELGNHTWSHVSLDDLSTSEAVAQVERAEVVLSEAGARRGLFRAPFGDISADLSRALARSRLLPFTGRSLSNSITSANSECLRLMPPTHSPALCEAETSSSPTTPGSGAKRTRRSAFEPSDTRAPSPQASRIRLSIPPGGGTALSGFEGSGNTPTLVLAIRLHLSAVSSPRRR